MHTILQGRLAALTGFIALAALLAACGGSSGAGGTACVVGDPTTTLAGTWIGTRTEGAQTVPLGADRMLHAATGAVTLTFTEPTPGTFAGNITINTDICWTEADGDIDPDRSTMAALTVTLGVVTDCVDFEYDSPLVGPGAASVPEPVRFRAPYPPTTSWTGSYNGTACDSSEDPTPWVGNFTVGKQP